MIQQRWVGRRDGGGDGVAALLDDPSLAGSVETYASVHGMPLAQVRAEVGVHLGQMLASHTARVASSWSQFGAWMLRAHDVLVDEDEMARLRELDREHCLALVFSHRSYLDGWVLPNVLAQRGFSPTYTFGGANLDLPLLGPMASRTGVIFIRRATKDLPLYRLALRGYIAHLVARGSNLAWSIEGGRTRTGKLRPPVHGILHYLSDAAMQSTGADVMLVPVSIVYDQLHEVAGMTAEARGSRKRPEDLTWLMRFARSQRQRLGRAYVQIGEPLLLRDRLGELRGAGIEGFKAVERVALDVSHRINRATPVTVTAIVCLALLGADRALTFDRVMATVHPLAQYIGARNWPVAGAASLTDRSTIRRALQELVASSVLTCYDAGVQPVWRIAPDQHLVAAFYRNTVIHILVERAIGEVALLAAEDAPGLATGADGEVPSATDPASARRLAWEQAEQLRELLKFEFFFPSRRAFDADLLAELALLAPDEDGDLSPSDARRVLEGSELHLAHLVLRPFVDAYLVVADRLAARGGSDVTDPDQLLEESLRLGRQWEMEGRIASAESVTLELFRTGLKLADHRGLVRRADEGTVASLARRRRDFVTELQSVVGQLNIIGELARTAAPAASPGTGRSEESRGAS